MVRSRAGQAQVSGGNRGGRRPEPWRAPPAPLAGPELAGAEAQVCASRSIAAPLAGPTLVRTSVTPGTPKFYDLGQAAYLNLDFSAVRLR